MSGRQETFHFGFQRLQEGSASPHADSSVVLEA